MTKRGLEGFQDPQPLFDMCQTVTWTSQNLKTLSNYIFKSHNSLHDHVQFIITIMFMLRQCIWGLRRSKMCHWEKPVPTWLVFMLSSGPNTSLKLSQAMQKQRIHTFVNSGISFLKLHRPQGCHWNTGVLNAHKRGLTDF